MINWDIQAILNDTIINFIVGSLLFITLNIFEDIQENKYYCPLYCDTYHKHRFETKKEDE
tara:strand:+ start:528 stop:707 length:180 start_codon:yes stop_codon:yes gene_type:complete